MFAEKSESFIKKTLMNLCCSNGWCYGIFWGFDQGNSLLLTVKDAYYEEQMAVLIDSMLLQVHVVGGGVIGQVAFAKNHQWVCSDAHYESLNSLESFGNLDDMQDDSEFYCQFAMGIKTIALISVEPWGVVQLGSTQKQNPEKKDFVDQVRTVFRGMDKRQEMELSQTEPPSDSLFLDPETQFSSLLSCGLLDSANQDLKHVADYEGFVESGNFFDCSATQALSNNSDCSVLTSLWPHLTSGLDQNPSFSTPSDYESCRDLSLNDNVNSFLAQQLSEDMFNTHNLTCNAQTSTGLLTLDELFQERDFAEAISRSGLDDDPFQWFAPQPGTTGLVPLSSPVRMEENLPTNSIQSSTTDAFRSNAEGKCSGKLFDTLGVNPGYKKPLGWNETLIPVINGDGFSSTGPKARASNSLFSKLGLDQLLDGTASTSSCSFVNSRFEDQSSPAAKRRKTNNFNWSHNPVKVEGQMNLLNPVYDPETRNSSEASTKGPGPCIGDISVMDAGKTSSSTRLDEPVKKKKAKPGTKPRPKDRQMIQDRLAELRELIPNGEKMSIDRLLERTIRHMNFMQSLQKHAESLKQIDNPKSKEVKKNNISDGCGGVTWACEVGDQNMVCPLIVEDLSTPGQMLIEILCEEQGFFLEIVDVIRGFGLIILKGVMEVREETNKIWAHFMVEAEGTRCVTRHEIFSSLIQLVQMTGQSPAITSDGFGNVISSGVPSSDNYQPAAVSFPVNMADAIQCANL